MVQDLSEMSSGQGVGNWECLGWDLDLVWLVPVFSAGGHANSHFNPWETPQCGRGGLRNSTGEPKKVIHEL